jgi:peptidoglycan DL-endopeptidase CwlO
VASHQIKRTIRAMLAATAVAAAAMAGLVPTPATAVPAPDPNQQLNDLSQQAGILNEQVLRARDELAAKQAELDKANADGLNARNAAADARNQEATARQGVDQLTRSAFQGAQFSQLSALLTSSSTQQYLDQSSMLDVLSRQNQASLSELSALVAQTAAAEKAAQAGQQQAQQAADAAAKTSNDLRQKQDALDTQIQQVKTQLAQLSAPAKAALANPGNMGSFAAPSGIAGAAMQVALAQRGIMYVWGGTSPSQGFDCSGLIQYAFAQKGVSLPRTAQAQFGVGQPVSRDALQPGDLVFFGSPGNIYHDGIYVGNNEMVNAATFGTPVRVQAVWPTEFAGGRRIGA